MTAAPLLRVDRLGVRFGSVTAVASVSFTVNSGEVFGIVGESGAGKSAAAKAIIGLLPKTAKVRGSVEYRGEELVGADRSTLRRVRGGGIGYVFQDALTALDPVRRVGDQLVEALPNRRETGRKAAAQLAESLLAEVQIKNPARCMQSYPHQLSGGMRQRVVIAAALIADPELIIADEVTSALDVTVQRRVLELLLNVCADRGAAVMLITHDLGVVAQTCDRVAVLYGGVVAEEADVFQLFDAPRHPYTYALMASMPHIGVDAPFIPIPGSAIQVVGELAACPFAPRCNHTTDECRRALPEIVSEGDRAVRCVHPLEEAVV